MAAVGPPHHIYQCYFPAAAKAALTCAALPAAFSAACNATDSFADVAV